MKNKLLLTLAISLLSLQGYSQWAYTFSYYTDTYRPLDTATEFKPGVVWTADSVFSAPIGFHFMMDTLNCPTFFSQAGSFYLQDTANVTSSGFLVVDAALDDRGFGTSTAKSPVRYKVTGTAGNRIFKSELFNAGFDQQQVDGNALTDSINVQVWYYEDSGTVEMRFGPSHITGTDYFQEIGAPLCGYGQDIDTNGTGYLYLLKGAPTHPTVQTVHQINGSPTTIPAGLSSYPPNGMVYRFSRVHPINVGVPAIFTDDNVLVYPTATKGQLNIRFTGSETATYEVISVSGSNMNLNGQVQKGITAIDVANLPSGVYLLHLQGGADSKVYKFVKL